MTLPTFLIIGAPKSGTTSLNTGFRQHPDVFMCDPKEPNYFIGESRPRRKVADLQSYERLFAAGAGHRARGEASTGYLGSASAPEAARQLIPDAALLAVLRDPVARAHSAWADLRQRNREPIDDFLTAVEAETSRAERDSFPNLGRYVHGGQYAAHLERWLQHFPRDQLLVHLTDELHRDPVAVLQRCYEHVGVRSDFEPNMAVRFNRSGERRSPRLSALLDGFGDTLAGRIARRTVPVDLRHRTRERLRAANLRPSPPLDDRAYDELAPRFAADLARLQGLLGRDLSEWRTVRHLDLAS